MKALSSVPTTRSGWPPEPALDANHGTDRKRFVNPGLGGGKRRASGSSIGRFRALPSCLTLEERCVSTETFDELFNQLHRLAPFRRGRILFEKAFGEMQSSVLYEVSSSGPRGRTTMLLPSTQALHIPDYIAGLNRFCEDGRIFYWRARQADPVYAQGVAAGIFSPTTQTCTLVQLDYISQLPDPTRMASLTWVAAYLHCKLGASSIKNLPTDKTPAPGLSPRETEVVRWMSQGKTSWEAGQILAVSERAIKFHLKNIYTKLSVTNRAQAIAAAIRFGII